MMDDSTGIIVGIVILLAAIPYVLHIRHPQQKTLAAYFIFLSLFVIVSMVLNTLLLWLASKLDLLVELHEPVPAVIFLILNFLPAFLIARWQARKPPWRQGPLP